MKFKIKAEICCGHGECLATTLDEVELEELPNGALAVVGFNTPDDWYIKDATDGAFIVFLSTSSEVSLGTFDGQLLGGTPNTRRQFGCSTVP